MHTRLITAALLLPMTVGSALAATPILVDPENFTRAESDLFFGNVVRDAGLGTFQHRRTAMRIDDQFVVRGNRDTLYSVAVFDLDAGPVTITVPDAGERFLSLQVIDEDQYIPDVFYKPGTYPLTREGGGTRYVGVAVRILINPDDPADVAQATALQDAIRIDQPGGPGAWDVPAWDTASQTKVRNALLTLAETLPDTRRAFGRKGEVDPVRRLIQSAAAWGGNPDKDALYLSETPAGNDGKTAYVLKVKDVPVEGFWSVSVYNDKGYYVENPLNAYNLNSITAAKDADGGITVQFGQCGQATKNCLPIMPGWNYMVRLYRPGQAILDNRWSFPKAVKMK